MYKRQKEDYKLKQQQYEKEKQQEGQMKQQKEQVLRWKQMQQLRHMYQEMQRLQKAKMCIRDRIFIISSTAKKIIFSYTEYFDDESEGKTYKLKYKIG